MQARRKCLSDRLIGYIAAIGSLVSAGIGLAGDLSKGSAGAGIGAEGGTLQHAASLYIQPFTNPAYWQINPQTMAQQSINFGIGQAPQINTANMQQLQALLGAALPGYQGAVAGMQANNASLIAGNIPTDVQNQIQRFGAQSTLTSGIGGAGGAAQGAAGGAFASTNKTITARDLGLTSLSLQQQGQTQESNLLNLTRNYLMPQPVNPTSLLPLNDLIGAQQWQDVAQFQANEAAYTAASNFASTQAGQIPTQGLGGTGGDISGLIAALTKNQPQGGQGQQGTSLLSGLFNMFGGGGGGAGSVGGMSSTGVDLTGGFMPTGG